MGEFSKEDEQNYREAAVTRNSGKGRGIMGKYLDIGNDGFQSIIRTRYVDKTGLISYINSTIDTTYKLTCSVRPRRFGKSFSSKMLCAYYVKGYDSHELFKGLEIEKDNTFLAYLNKFHVIYLDITSFLSACEAKEDTVDYMKQELLHDLQNSFSFTSNEKDILSTLLSIANKTKEKFIFIIDEWDAIYREQKDNKKLQEEYMELLRSLFKSVHTDKICAAAYMTGILPIKKYGRESALSDFYEYTMVNAAPIESYVGFTLGDVKQLCEENHLELDKLNQWYDGYRLGEEQIYNPKSVMECIRRKKYGNYWTRTETYESLKTYIELNFDGLKDAIIDMIGGQSYKVDTESFQNDLTTLQTKDDVLTLLIHLGYLAYDEKERQVSIPNREIKEEFIRAIKNGNRTELVKAIQKSDELLKATWNKDSDIVAEIISELHDTDTSHEFYNNEQALRSVIKMAYLSSIDFYVKLEELQAGKGYADIVFWPKKNADYPMLLVELKWNQSAEGAIAQIKERKYPSTIQKWDGEILLVGINYDKKTRIHECKILEMNKER